MKNTSQRWYEKDEYLKAFMGLIEKLPVDEQCAIAIDIIIQATSMLEREYEKVIGAVGQYDPREFRRWYDKNPNLHVAIESLRDLEQNQREEIIKNFTDRILNLHNYKLEGLDD